MAQLKIYIWTNTHIAYKDELYLCCLEWTRTSGLTSKLHMIVGKLANLPKRLRSPLFNQICV